MKLALQVAAMNIAICESAASRSPNFILARAPVLLRSACSTLDAHDRHTPKPAPTDARMAGAYTNQRAGHNLTPVCRNAEQCLGRAAAAATVIWELRAQPSKVLPLQCMAMR